MDHLSRRAGHALLRRLCAAIEDGHRYEARREIVAEIKELIARA